MNTYWDNMNRELDEAAKSYRRKLFWEGVVRDLNSPEFKRRFYQTVIPTAILSGIISLGVHSLGNYLSKHEFVPKDRMAIVERIDRDELTDVVVGRKILLADPTDEGTVYRPLRDSDIYRIK